MAGTFTANGVVPVEMKDFRIGISAQNKPLLQWETITEQNVSHFTIRKSTNGFDYTEIGNVAAVGHSVTCNRTLLPIIISTAQKSMCTTH